MISATAGGIVPVDRQREMGPIEGERSKVSAIARMELPAARPLGICSRSSSDNHSSERSLAVGCLPPASAMNTRSERPPAMRLICWHPPSRGYQMVCFSCLAESFQLETHRTDDITIRQSDVSR